MVGSLCLLALQDSLKNFASGVMITTAYWGYGPWSIILGGLVKDEKRTTRKGVPLLSRIPLLKYLFSANVDETYKSEMVILITPRILTGRESFASEMTRLGVDRFVEDGS